MAPLNSASAKLRTVWDAARRPGRAARLFLALAASVAFAGMPATARAADDEENPTDGRLEGYEGQVALPKSSTGTTYLLLVVLILVCLSGLFKDAKRTHLD